MDYQAKYREILCIAATEKLPHDMNKRSEIPVRFIRDLLEAGLLKATDESDLNGLVYIDARITVAGLEYLSQLESRDAAPWNH
ncbi:MAG: hypothetical protein ABI640_10845 [Gammaproteobacteria bacterium]